VGRGAAAGDAAGAHQPPAAPGRGGLPGRPGGPWRDLTAYLTHAAGLVAAREAGVLKRWRATPLPRWGYLAGRLCATVLLALASGAVTVLVGVLVYHARLSAGAALGMVVTLGLAALAWACVGTALTPLIPTVESAQPLLAFSYFPVMLLSGALGGLGGTPSWVADLLGYLPGQPTVEAATRALQATGGLPVLAGHDLAVLGAWAVGGGGGAGGRVWLGA
jgi:ABC-2 type transport system permease protein